MARTKQFCSIVCQPVRNSVDSSRISKYVPFFPIFRSRKRGERKRREGRQ